MNYKTLKSEQLRFLLDDPTFKTEPLLHQWVSLAWMLAEADRAMLWLDIGTGKTLTAIYASLLRGCRRTLVVSPNPVIESWEEQFTEHSDMTYTVLSGSTANRENLLLTRDTDAYVINYEGLKYLFGKKINHKFFPDYQIIKSGGFDNLIIDECHRLKNKDSIQTQICHELSRHTTYCTLMTGTPIGKSELDLWAEYWVLDNGATLGNNFWSYANRYFKKRFYSYYISKGGRVDLLKKVAPVTLRYERQECFDLPEKTYQTRFIDMSSEQKKAMDEIISQVSVTDLEEGPAINVLQATSKLAQIAGGFLYEENREPKYFKANPKIKELNRTLTEVEGKCIIFHEFVAEGRMIEEALRTRKIKFASLRAETKDKKAEYKRFKEDASAKILIANPQTGGEGLNFQEASTIIFYSNGYSGATIREQAEGRIWRYGQKQNCLFIDLVMRDSIDVRKMHVISDKKQMAQEVLSFIRDWKEND